MLLRIHPNITFAEKSIFICFLCALSDELYARQYYNGPPPYVPRWIKISQPQTYEVDRRYYRSTYDNDESGRHFKAETINKITETLGAINTVGRYLVNMTRNGEAPNNVSPEIPSALYTISKNVLGRNVTDTLAPFVREALPVVAEDNKVVNKIDSELNPNNNDEEQDDSKTCTTPDGREGICDDLSNCPQLLLNLGNLRQSLCFKSLFVPGVCCPKTTLQATVTTSEAPLIVSTDLATTSRPVTFAAIYYNTEKPSTVTLIKLTPVTNSSKPFQAIPVINNYVNPEDCGQPESANFRVVGGEEALPGRWPWMAAIFLHGTRRTEFWCGGSLITARHVLTAAHCTKDSRQRSFAAHQFSVRLGDIDLKRDDEPSAPVTFKVAEIRSHAHFSRIGFYNDIAILRLDRPARKSKYVIPLCLPPSNLRREKFAGRKSTVVGWGTTYYGGKESTVQRQAVLPVWRNEDCNDAYFQPINSNFICAGYSQGGTDACQGDSGGPLMIYWDVRWIQVGVVSFGNKCGEPGYPGVYTRITEYLDWIEEHTKT